MRKSIVVRFHKKDFALNNSQMESNAALKLLVDQTDFIFTTAQLEPFHYTFVFVLGPVQETPSGPNEDCGLTGSCREKCPDNLIDQLGSCTNNLKCCVLV